MAAPATAKAKTPLVAWNLYTRLVAARVLLVAEQALIAQEVSAASTKAASDEAANRSSVVSIALAEVSRAIELSLYAGPSVSPDAALATASTTSPLVTT
jgi:hypothetical protein